MSNIVFVGAGGTGMSSLACLLYDLGYHNLVCIDASDSLNMQQLRDKGITKVFIGHGRYAVQRQDMVIYSDIASIAQGPEVTQSRIYQQTPTKKYFHICMTYNQFVAEISKRFITVAVAGSNGKTSTTGMMIYTMNNAQCIMHNDSEFGILNSEFALGIVGGLMPNFNQQGYAINETIKDDIRHLFEHILNQKQQLDYSLLKKYIFVIEACEYKEHFLMYDVDYALITNVERDHTDYFTTIESYREAFKKLIHQTRHQVIIPEGITVDHLSEDTDKIVRSTPFVFGNQYIVGKYHESNAGMIQTFAQKLKCGNAEMPKDVFESLSLGDLLQNRKGMGRRMELLKQWDNGSRLYSDYSHHAPAISGNIQALKKKFPDHKLVVIFQPHQAQRVLAGRDDFATALQGADETIIYKLYTAREDFDELQKIYPQLKSLHNFDELGLLFADRVDGKYITDINLITREINITKERYIYVFFSAGDLDALVRNSVL